MSRGQPRQNGEFQRELASFRDVWPDGYLEGDPLDPLGASGYRQFGYISVLYAVYVCCIKPYVTPDTVALELGPGRGTWTRTLLSAREVWCLDAKSREDNGIDEWLGHPRNLVYHQIRDFECTELPDDYFDYLFSFGALCHVSWTGITRYAERLFAKMRPGANAFWMVADYDQANRIWAHPSRFDVVSRVRANDRLRLVRAAERRFSRILGRRSIFWPAEPGGWYRRLEGVLGARLVSRPKFKDKSEAEYPSPGRWYHAGAERTADLLQRVGFSVVSQDVGLVPRDPILHFRKPSA